MKSLFFFLGACVFADQLGYGDSTWVPLGFFIAIVFDIAVFFVESFIKAKSSQKGS